MIPSVLAILRSLFGTPAARSPQTARLGFDTCEDRVVPATITFTNGILYVDADAATNDTVLITSAGTAKDGSTGVKVLTNVTGTWTCQKFGGTGNPVTNIALDMKDGNDFVDVASLRSTVVLVGEGNGNNFVEIGDTLAGGVIAGSGQNIISVGNSTLPNAFGSFNLPGTANSVAFVGWGYSFASGGTGIFLNGNTGNTNNNAVLMRTDAGFRSFVDIVGTGNNTVVTRAGDDGVSIIGSGANFVSTGAGNDLVRVQGDGNNCIFTGGGNDTVEINGFGDNCVRAGDGNDQVTVFGNGNNVIRGGHGDDILTIVGGGNNQVYTGDGNNTTTISGSGNNTVRTRGTGSITVTGDGMNTVRARYSPGVTIALDGAGPGSSVVASLASGVFVDGNQVTESGVSGNVTVTFVEPVV